MTHDSGSRLMLYFRIVWLMYSVSVITYVLNILDTFNTGVTRILKYAKSVRTCLGLSDSAILLWVIIAVFVMCCRLVASRFWVCCGLGCFILKFETLSRLCLRFETWFFYVCIKDFKL